MMRPATAGEIRDAAARLTVGRVQPQDVGLCTTSARALAEAEIAAWKCGKCGDRSIVSDYSEAEAYQMGCAAEGRDRVICHGPLSPLYRLKWPEVEVPDAE